MQNTLREVHFTRPCLVDLQVLGKALKDLPRDKIIVSTKVGQQAVMAA
jgi:hypothetical protein